MEKLLSIQMCFFVAVESANTLLTFRKKDMFQKNLVYELWSKNMKINQNAGFFTLQFVTNKLKYEVEFLDGGIGQGCLDMAKVTTNSLSVLFQG